MACMSSRCNYNSPHIQLAGGEVNFWKMLQNPELFSEKLHVGSDFTASLLFSKRHGGAHLKQEQVQQESE